MVNREVDKQLVVDDDDLSGEFVTWSLEAVKTMRSLVSGLPETPLRSDPSVGQIYDLTHNMKGMGTSFGYSLLTAIGTSLCGYLKTFTPDMAVSCRVLESHIRAQEVVVENGIKGAGGEKGQALISRLRAIIAEETKASGAEFDIP